jgi:hypothetical protein
MTDKEKYLILAGIAAAGLGWWWYSGHMTATAQIVSQPTAPTVANNTVSVAPPIATPATGQTSASGVNQSELAALLAWTQKTQNPTLYAQMMNQLSAGQIDQLYGILTTEWTTGASPTAAQTSFWNSLVSQYPFLAKGGVGCSTLTC